MFHLFREANYFQFRKVGNKDRDEREGKERRGEKKEGGRKEEILKDFQCSTQISDLNLSGKKFRSHFPCDYSIPRL